MVDPILKTTHRLLTAIMVVVALTGWGAYASSASSSATRDQERIEALARLSTHHDGLVSEQQRLQRELTLANARLAMARDEVASLEEQRKVAKKGGLGAFEPVDPPRKSAQKRPSKATAGSGLANEQSRWARTT